MHYDLDIPQAKPARQVLLLTVVSSIRLKMPLTLPRGTPFHHPILTRPVPVAHQLQMPSLHSHRPHLHPRRIQLVSNRCSACSPRCATGRCCALLGSRDSAWVSSSRFSSGISRTSEVRRRSSVSPPSSTTCPRLSHISLATR